MGAQFDGQRPIKRTQSVIAQREAIGILQIFGIGLRAIFTIVQELFGGFSPHSLPVVLFQEAMFEELSVL